MLQFGHYYIQISHLQRLIDEVPKDEHGITQSVLDPSDRQNFDSVLRICHPRVFAALKKYVKGSNGTVKYLEIVKNFLDAYIDDSLSPLGRISKLWHSIFVVRMWRIYVLNHNSHTLKNNFMTSHTYRCLELNAHSMVLILLHHRENNESKLFKPWLYSSQPCESFYRQIRAFSPCNSNMTNCTVKETIDRIHKIQLQNEISTDDSTSFMFHQKKSSQLTSTSSFELPTEQEIFDTINKVKMQAIEDSIILGLIDEEERNISLDCDIIPYSLKKKSSKLAVDEDSFSDFQDDEEFDSHMEILDRLKRANMKNYADQFEDDKTVPETSPYTEVFGGNKRIVLKKQSLVWLLRKNGKKLSSDRLQRVKTDRSTSPKKKQSKYKKQKSIYNPNGYISKRKFIRPKKIRKK